MRLYGLDVSEEQIFIMSGSVESINAICMTLMRPGVDLLHAVPAWIIYRNSFRAFGARMNPIEMDSQGIVKEGFLRSIQNPQNTVLYTTPCFSYPTGISMSAERKIDILNICHNARIPIIEMDLYREFKRDLPKPLASMDNSGNVIYIGALDELFPMGLSLSWVVVPSVLTERFYHYKAQSDHVSIITQLFFYYLFKTGHFYEYMDKYNEFIRYRRKYTHDVLTRYLGDLASWNPEGHPLIHWLRFHEPVDLDKIAKISGIPMVPAREHLSKDSQCVAIGTIYLEEEKFLNNIKCISGLIRADL
jgi:GntR family transcriptional regulator of abcA and norABC